MFFEIYMVGTCLENIVKKEEKFDWEGWNSKILNLYSNFAKKLRILKIILFVPLFFKQVTTIYIFQT